MTSPPRVAAAAAVAVDVTVDLIAFAAVVAVVSCLLAVGIECAAPAAVDFATVNSEVVPSVRALASTAPGALTLT